MNIITLENVSFSYDGEGRILNDVSFSVSEGEILVIAGLSGCGKTTLCYILTGIIPKSVQGRLRGTVRIGQRDVCSMTAAETAETAGMVFQNPDDQIICTTVEDEIAFGPENLCMAPEEIRRRVDEMLNYFGLQEYALKNPAELSGGQKKLVTIAGVLVMKPEILILDEPMTGLDDEARALVRKSILRMHDEGKTLIIVEHDLSLVDYTHRILYLDEGKIR